MAPVATLASRLQAAGTPVPKIRISGIKIHRLSQKLKEPIGWCCRTGSTATGTTVIEVETDAGITGWGDGSWGSANP